MNSVNPDNCNFFFGVPTPPTPLRAPPKELRNSDMVLSVGAKAQKVGGSYQANGTIVSAFRTNTGELRYVFEFDEPKGMLHIFGPSQVALSALKETPTFV